MSIFKSFFSKNNTLIEDNLTNNSQNPVTEISYGTLNAVVSRFIFDIDLEPLKQKIANGEITEQSIEKHVLKLTNTIRFREDLLSKRRGDNDEVIRASSFELELFNVTEDWDEGGGYDFVYIDEQFPQLPKQASNWIFRKTDIPWEVEGAYIDSELTGTTAQTSQILATQEFEKGSEDIYIDITDYINSQLFSGNTGFTDTTYGLGLKFSANIEVLELLDRYAVAFHAKDTHTFFEPHIETTINDRIEDDRNFFFMDKENELYLYSVVGGKLQDVDVSGVTIYDYEDNIYDVITGDNITKVRKGIYKISLNIGSDQYPDAVLFTDEWTIIQNGKTKKVSQEFYLINSENYYNFDFESVNFNNLYFNFNGILKGEKIKVGDNRRITINVKQLYNQDYYIPLDLEYRVYTNQTDKFQIDVIPFTNVNRTKVGYEFFIDTSWMIPQDYNLELKLNSGSEYQIKNNINFTIVSEL